MASNHHSKRKAADGAEFQFYVLKAPEIDRRFAGKHVAIIGLAYPQLGQIMEADIAYFNSSKSDLP